MFKNLKLFKIIQAVIPQNFADALEARGFVPCGASQEKSVGWVPPRGGEHDEYAPVIGGHTILKRINGGWNVSLAIQTPVRPKASKGQGKTEKHLCQDCGVRETAGMRCIVCSNKSRAIVCAINTEPQQQWAAA